RAQQDVHATAPGRDRQEGLAAHRPHAGAPAQGRRAEKTGAGDRLMFLSITIDLEPNLFRLGPFLITWHGVFSVLGILAAARLGLWLLSKDGVDTSRGF